MPETSPPLRRQPLNSVTTKIIAFVFLSTFLTALVVSWISIQSTHVHLRRQIDEEFPTLLGHVARNLERWTEAGLRELQRRGPPEAADAGWGLGSNFEKIAFIEPGGRATWTAGAGPLSLAHDLHAALGPPVPGRARAGLAPVDDHQALLVAWVDTAEGRWLGLFSSATLAELFDLAAIEADAKLHLVDAGLREVPWSGHVNHPLGEGTSKLLGYRSGEVHEYSSAGGEHLLGSRQAVRSIGAQLLIEETFESAFAPVLKVVTRIFLSDLCIILIFSFLAYRITTRIMAPIEALSDGAQRISRGQIDHEIPDPRSGDEIGLLTRTFNEMMRKLRQNQLDIEQANQRLSSQYEELLTANEVLAQLSITDGLTKLHNHRYFQDHLSREIKRVDRTAEPLAILLLDLDDFKRFNDRMGHAAGDELLVRVARVMSESIRESDLLARYGGEEFVVLAPNTDLAGAVALAEKIRMAVGDTEHRLEDGQHPARVTISIGVAIYDGDRKGFFQQADRALYRAKAEGKNCVVVDEASRPAVC